MEKYKYTGPTMLLGENDELELRNGMEVLAEVNINIAKVKIPVRMPFCLEPKEYEADVAAKYLEPVKPKPIHFDPKDDVDIPHFFDDLFSDIANMQSKYGKIGGEDFTQKLSEKTLDNIRKVAHEWNDGHEVGGNHYKMAIEPWDYIHIVQELTDTYKAKNHDYGNSFADLFSECGMPYAYGHLKEKLNRIKSLMSKEAEVKSENMVDSLMDLANYAILTIMELRKEGKC